ncbi:2-amino-4-hydroxy-6-hydroxymethyldihydropteridine diphosphokinase [Parashewanella curva]|uniref:2-amino-4-hydroxy-6-hydroxymethyldihydropteridine pyrophosphokinase n=1 Tax=Parashewanella curva TaxID=2338552 RepID=A0A3L8Q0B2_9GAMM|nr:2-amino-4-hydroxy-6-hydroxymethyldihydropteridine diphosphokinase [Parashewanella curva]RLV60228.1 2-amino-4-hydroxy-6-hydroxymethyldihydropteridine diphosphokinase [Parashewanella curva]
MAKAYIALGANLEQPKAQLDAACVALEALAETGSFQISPYYASVPMGEFKQPDYINAVASIETQHSPLELLDALQAIEQQQGRVRLQHWGPRTLDLDLLLYDNLVMTSERLTIPHYGMKQRSFVLVPLFNLSPELILPCETPLKSLISAKLRSELQELDSDH